MQGADLLTLPADPRSVRTARLHISEVLRAAGREDLIDDAVLAVSEIVANVVLHARTACELGIDISESSVRISVRDFSVALPTQRHFSDTATTGRGLVLVGRLSASFGIDAMGADGKVVWFVLDGVSKEFTGDPDDEWDLTGVPDAGAGPDVAMLVHVPMTIWLAGLEHQVAVLRELYLVLATEHQQAIEDAVDLAAADAALRALTEGSDRALQAAAEREDLPRLAPLPDGHPAVLPPAPAVLDVPISTATDSSAFGALQDALDLGQELAVEGYMLVRPALDELIALRDWACDQVVAQSTGQAATAWDATTQSMTRAIGAPYRRPEWDDTMVRTATRAVVAADDSNRIISVSPAAAELLAGSVEDLVGRRLTTIIPHRLREQHVAGFTRHLATGEHRVLGVELDMPVLRLDGQEVVRRFLITQVAAPAGRAIYVAWLDPVPD